jgi:NADPH-dependent 2,4-dienoyl-CoA reductase/sulfur reductase-like enzyme
LLLIAYRKEGRLQLHINILKKSGKTDHCHKLGDLMIINKILMIKLYTYYLCIFKPLNYNNPMLSAKRVLIVGGGPVGLSAALFLNKLGVNLRVIEKNTQLPEYSKALGINARTLELMNTVGATERILKEALKIRQVHIYYNEKLVTSNQLD